MDVSEREELWDDIARLEDANTELQAENETLHKKLIILRNAKCPKCQHRFKIRKLSKDAD